MISLSKRLSAIAEMVPQCSILADVGTDHGYLPVRLLQQGIAERVLASDIHKGPLLKATETAEIYGFSDRMDTFLADGLQFPGAESAEVITICGMGGETMISILSAAPWTVDGRRLILQPQSKLAELETWLQLHRYVIEDARLCIDTDRIYLIISVSGGIWNMNSEEILFRKQDPLFSDYIKKELQKARFAMQGLMRASKDRTESLRRMEQRIQTLEHYEKEILKW